MKQLLVLVFSWCALPVLGQDITAAELIDKAQCTNFSCYAPLFASRGYSFTDHNVKDTSFVYSFAQPPVAGKNGNNMLWVEAGYYTNTITFSTGSYDDYFKLMNSFKSLGFLVQSEYKEDVNYGTLASVAYPNFTLTYFEGINYTNANLYVTISYKK